MSTIRRRNPRLQGDIGLSAAIGWFSANGYAVSIPLCDNQPYDLVVDDGEQYVIPSSVITAKRAINLCAKYAGYRVSDWPMKDAPKQLRFGADGVVGEGFEPS